MPNTPTLESTQTIAGDLEIKPRRMSFPYENIDKRWFFDNNALKTAFIAALSSTFPPGEGEFIDSVRLYRDKIHDPVLQKQIRGFIGQEGHHSFQHKQANEVLTERGLDAVRLEKHLERDIEKFLEMKRSTPKFRLAMTVGMEHVTAIMAEYVLTHPEAMENLDDSTRQLLLWHAVEEIEHKAVAFDVYMQAEGDRAYLRKAAAFVTMTFVIRITCYMAGLLWWARKWPSWREFKDFGRFMFGKNGIIRKIRRPYKDFFKPDFHPWDHDNQELVDQWKQEHYREEHDLGAQRAKQAATAAA